MKVVLAARTMGVGHGQLPSFRGTFFRPKPPSHKTVHIISKKVRAAAAKAVTGNLAEAKKITTLGARGSD